MIPSQTQMRRARGAIALGLAVLVSGCGGLYGFNGGDTVVARYEQVYPISVETGAELLELTSLNGLPTAEIQRVDGFVAEYRRRGEGEITIAYPADQDADRTVAMINARLARAGVAEGDIVRGPYSRDADGDRGVVMSYMTPVAVGSGCPDFWGDTVNDPSNGSMPRLGCATRQNFAAMVAQPRDLLAPQPMTPPDSEARSRALMAYRAGKDTRSEDRITVTDTRE